MVTVPHPIGCLVPTESLIMNISFHKAKNKWLFVGDADYTKTSRWYGGLPNWREDRNSTAVITPAIDKMYQETIACELESEGNRNFLSRFCRKELSSERGERWMEPQSRKKPYIVMMLWMDNLPLRPARKNDFIYKVSDGFKAIFQSLSVSKLRYKCTCPTQFL